MDGCAGLSAPIRCDQLLPSTVSCRFGGRRTERGAKEQGIDGKRIENERGRERRREREREREADTI